MTLQELIAALSGAGDDAIGTMMRAPNTRPPKMNNPTEPQPYTPPPYGALGQGMPPPQAPQLPIGVEPRLQAVPFQRARWQPSDDALNMDAPSPTGASGGPARGMEPPDAPAMPPMQQSYIPRPDPELAGMLSRSRDSLDWYRNANQRELEEMQARRDRLAAQAELMARRRNNRP